MNHFNSSKPARLCAGALASVLALAGCSSSDSSPAAASEADVVRNYATLVDKNYSEVLTTAKALRTAVDTFVGDPTAANLEATKAAWKSARIPYGQSESYRFYDGPIDNSTDGPEGRINSWPLDENFVDYTQDEPGAGIINEVSTFPQITKDMIRDENEKGGEKNLSAGYHAIEFLLWGQDHNANGPGARPYTDYVSGSSGTATNQDRRRDYLKAVTDLLVDDLTSVEVQWKPSTPGNYAESFGSGGKDSVTKMLKGIGSLSGAELSKERMNNAYETRDQEEEHSCFSDTTTTDLYNNALGIQNVYLGRYGDLDGPGLDELVAAKDAALNDRVKGEIATAVAAVQAIPAPFDQAILGDDSSVGRRKIKAAMDSLAVVTASFSEVANKLNLTINLE